mmetsp:Transcript_7955/g.19631  ORF Transcript_7955/g.19631 Transcript_7955/m.19631 type:complete len:214 (-) Transcript_7955:225-866(-)
MQCALCGSRAGVWNFDKHVERPCQLDYLTLKCQSGQEAEAMGKGGTGSGNISGESLPTHSLKGTAGATGYTCLTSPLYVASPTVVNLHKTIAGGDTIASFGLQPDLPAPSPSEKDLAKAKEGESARELKKRLELNTRDPRLCRSAAMHPLNAHRKYCPWRYAAGGEGAMPGWTQCLQALAPNDSALDHPSKDDSSAHQGDVVSILNKVQRVIG